MNTTVSSLASVSDRVSYIPGVTAVPSKKWGACIAHEKMQTQYMAVGDVKSWDWRNMNGCSHFFPFLVITAFHHLFFSRTNLVTKDLNQVQN